MHSHPDRLPDRFPVGTRYIIEGSGGAEGRLRIHLRYLEFPDGRQLDLSSGLPVDLAGRARRPRSRRAKSRK
jgi:hypothetical protein